MKYSHNVDNSEDITLQKESPAKYPSPVVCKTKVQLKMVMCVGYKLVYEY